MSHRSYNPDDYRPRLTPGDVTRYQPMQRACDDPHVNFEKIRTASLWAAREKQAAGEAEKRLRFICADCGKGFTHWSNAATCSCSMGQHDVRELV